MNILNKKDENIDINLSESDGLEITTPILHVKISSILDKKNFNSKDFTKLTKLGEIDFKKFSSDLKKLLSVINMSGKINFQGIGFFINESGSKLVATDSTILIEYSTKAFISKEEKKFLVSKTELNMLANLNLDGNIEIYISDTQFIFRLNTFIGSLNFLNIQPINYKPIVENAKNNKEEFILEPNEFIENFKDIVTINSDSTKNLILDMSDSELKMYFSDLEQIKNPIIKHNGDNDVTLKFVVNSLKLVQSFINRADQIKISCSAKENNQISKMICKFININKEIDENKKEILVDDDEMQIYLVAEVI